MLLRNNLEKTHINTDLEVYLKELIIENLKNSKKSLSTVELFNLIILKNLISDKIKAIIEIQHIRNICEDLVKDGIIIEKEIDNFIYYKNIKNKTNVIMRSVKSKVQKEIYLPILGIIIGELLMFMGQIYPGLAVHIINLQAISIAIIFGKYSDDTKKVLQSLLLLSMMRIINLSMPQFFAFALLRYPLVYGIMFIPIYYVIKNQNITLTGIGIDFRRWHIYLPAALLIGTAMAMLEFQILHPAPLISTLKLQNLLLISMVMFVFVAAVEELIFRSILITRLEKVFGSINSILLSSLLFGIMHAGYGLLTEVLFATCFGFILGFIFLKTRSLPFIIVIHGTANVLLFGILPIIS